MSQEQKRSFGSSSVSSILMIQSSTHCNLAVTSPLRITSVCMIKFKAAKLQYIFSTYFIWLLGWIVWWLKTKTLESNCLGSNLGSSLSSSVILGKLLNSFHSSTVIKFFIYRTVWTSFRRFAQSELSFSTEFGTSDQSFLEKHLKLACLILFWWFLSFTYLLFYFLRQVSLCSSCWPWTHSCS